MTTKKRMVELCETTQNYILEREDKNWENSIEVAKVCFGL